jgi:hypothetical protein
MTYMDRFYNLKELVDTQILINSRQIQDMLGLDDEKLEEFISLPDFSSYEEFAGKKYWLREHVEMVAEAKGFHFD